MAAPDFTPSRSPVVSMPDEIDVTNAGEVLNLITAACGPGVTAVIVDLTATRFCDSGGLRHLLLAYGRVAAAGAQLRLAIPSDGPIGRVVELTGINRQVAVYPTLELAIDGTRQPG